MDQFEYQYSKFKIKYPKVHQCILDYCDRLGIDLTKWYMCQYYLHQYSSSLEMSVDFGPVIDVTSLGLPYAVPDDSLSFSVILTDDYSVVEIRLELTGD